MTRPRIYVATIAAVIATVVFTVTVTTGGATTTPLYKNPRAPISARVNDLLRRMTLAEKVGQMDQIVVEVLRAPTNPANGPCADDSNNNDPVQPGCMKYVLQDNLTGSILSGGTDNPPDNTGPGWANQYNTIQSFAINNTRLGIPILYGVDAVHGFNHPYQATLFPQEIGMGATWDTTLAEKAGGATAQQLCATGSLWDFSPVQDVARDNRWGRYYETWGEQPELTAALGAANVSGLQSSCGTGTRVAATVKHFAAYSQSINGHDRVEAQIPIRYLQDFFLPSYAGGINAGADTVMVDSGSINGIPATASHFLLTTELRERLHFNGVVISDYGDVPALATTYHVASDLAGAVAEAVNAGVDMAMEPTDPAGFNNALISDVHNGLVPMWRINQAVTRILKLKFKLGLFDHPYVDPSKAQAAITANQALARQAADESMTLLRNQNGVLPLSPSAKVVVAGPSADSVANMLGGWSVMWQGVFGSPQPSGTVGPPNQIPPAVTPWAAIKQADPSAVLATDQGSAVSDLGSADAAVVVVGEQPYAEGLGDNPSPQLSADQNGLISALEATGKPVIVVVLAGRPIGLGPGDDANAILMAYLPGTQGGYGVSDVLFGTYDPSGKLPGTWPSDAAAPVIGFNPGAPSPLGDQPKVFDQLPGTNFGPGSYVSRPVNLGGVLTPPLSGLQLGQLVGWTRTDLDAGASKTVSVTFPVSELAVTPGDIDAAGRQQVLPGTYQLELSSSQTASFTVH